MVEFQVEGVATGNSLVARGSALLPVLTNTEGKNIGTSSMIRA